MKKILFFTALLFAVIVNAQDEDFNKLTSLISVLKEKQDAKTVDSVYVELKSLENTTNQAVKITLPEVISMVKGIKEENLLKVDSKEISELTKDDLKSFKSNVDKFRNITFIHHKKEGGKVLPYLSIKNGFLNMRIQTYYSGKEWVFYKEVIFLNNNEKYIFKTDDPETKVHVGYVSEYSDDKASSEFIEYIKRAINSGSEIDVRFTGKSYYDTKLSKNEILVLKETIELYDKLKK